MFKIIAFAVLIASVSAGGTFWTRCEKFPNALLPDDVKSPNCDNEGCYGVRGGNFEANLLLTPNKANNRLRVRITTTVSAFRVILPLDAPYDDACNRLSIDGAFVGCPTVPNVQYESKMSFTIPTTWPVFSNYVQVEFVEVIDRVENVEFCFYIPNTTIAREEVE